MITSGLVSSDIYACHSCDRRATDVHQGVDDGELVEALMNLIGLMFVDCFHRLNRDHHPLARLLSPPELSPFKNPGLVMGLAAGFAESWVVLVCEDESVYWAKELLRLARARGIKLRDAKGPIGDDEGKEGDETAFEIDGGGGNLRDSTEDMPPCEDKLDFTKAVSCSYFYFANLWSTLYSGALANRIPC